MADFSQWWWQAAAAGPGPGPIDPGDPIGQSLRFRRQQRLNTRNCTRPVGDFTVSVWLKSSWQGTTDNNSIYGNNTSVTGYKLCNPNNASMAYQLACRDGSSLKRFSTARLRDSSAWYHAVFQNTGEQTTAFLNGVQLSITTKTFPKSGNPVIGSGNYGNMDEAFEGYMAQFIVVDGQVLDPTAFGRYNAAGVWVPVDPQGLTYGTNGFHLDFADPDDIGKDISGNDNHWEAHGFETVATLSPDYDVMEDTPTQNYAVISPLYPGASTSKANLTTANATGKPTILGIAGSVGVNNASVAWDGTEAGWTSTGAINLGQQPGGLDEFSTRTMPANELPDEITGTFTGNSNANGPFVYTGCIPGRIQYGSIDVTYDQRLGQTDVDFLSNGFKVRSTVSNSGSVDYTVTTTHVGGEYDGKKIPFNLPATATSN